MEDCMVDGHGSPQKTSGCTRLPRGGKHFIISFPEIPNYLYTVISCENFWMCSSYLLFEYLTRLRDWRTLNLMTGEDDTYNLWDTINHESWICSVVRTEIETAESRGRNLSTASLLLVWKCFIIKQNVSSVIGRFIGFFLGKDKKTKRII